MKQIELKIEGKNVLAEIYTKHNKEYVTITPICDAIGLMPHKQAERLKNNSQFNPSLIGGVGADGKQRDMLSIPVEEVGMWLCTINSRRVKEDVRDVLVAFQKHCQVELHAAITGRAGLERVEALEKQMASVIEQNKQMIYQNQQMMQIICNQDQKINALERKNIALEAAADFRATASSYGMHARKQELKARETMQ